MIWLKPQNKVHIGHPTLAGHGGYGNEWWHAGCGHPAQACPCCIRKWWPAQRAQGFTLNTWMEITPTPRTNPEHTPNPKPMSQWAHNVFWHSGFNNVLICFQVFDCSLVYVNCQLFKLSGFQLPYTLQYVSGFQLFRKDIVFRFSSFQVLGFQFVNVKVFMFLGIQCVNMLFCFYIWTFKILNVLVHLQDFSLRLITPAMLTCRVCVQCAWVVAIRALAADVRAAYLCIFITELLRC